METRIAAIPRQHLLTQDKDALALVAQRACGDDVAGRIRFVTELDALRTVERRSYVAGGSRLENSAEHSWHVATMALALAPLLGAVDIAHVVAMLLVHDIVEIDAGDVPVYDHAARAFKASEERVAATISTDFSRNPRRRTCAHFGTSTKLDRHPKRARPPRSTASRRSCSTDSRADAPGTRTASPRRWRAPSTSRWPRPPATNSSRWVRAILDDARDRNWFVPES